MTTWDTEKETRYGGRDPHAIDVDPYPDIPKQKKNIFSVKEMILFTLIPVIIPQIFFILFLDKYKLIHAVFIIISLTALIESVGIYIRCLLKNKIVEKEDIIINKNFRNKWFPFYINDELWEKAINELKNDDHMTKDIKPMFEKIQKDKGITHENYLQLMCYLAVSTFDLDRDKIITFVIDELFKNNPYLKK